ncbi:MAG: SufD family Fe-S cluster assembly protein [Anaerococcus sp.]|nr:SufD family Fe-S cluster assembly protein [Anaerococcus sp.]
MGRINEMRMPTWATLGLNYLDDQEFDIKNQAYFKQSHGKEIEEVAKALGAYKLGLSEKINKENKDYRNFSLAYEVSGKEELKKIDLNLKEDYKTLVSNIDIKANKDSKSSFIISIFDDNKDSFINSRIRLLLEEGSYLKLTLVTNLSEGSVNLNSLASLIKENATLDLTYIEVGASKSLVNIDNILKEEGARLILDGAYFKEGDDFLDLYVTNEHYGNNTDSSAYFNGALKDRAEKNFKGVVDLRRGCHKADGKIGDYSMMLSDQVINKSAPVLLNEEKEVAGNHAASVGRLNKDMLFYIMSRGFSKKQAYAMMLEANFAPAVDKIEDDDLRAKIKAKVHQMNSRD